MHTNFQVDYEPSFIFSLLYTVPKISSISYPYQCLVAPSAQKGLGREKIPCILHPDKNSNVTHGPRIFFPITLQHHDILYQTSTLCLTEWILIYVITKIQMSLCENPALIRLFNADNQGISQTLHPAAIYTTLLQEQWGSSNVATERHVLTVLPRLSLSLPWSPTTTLLNRFT